MIPCINAVVPTAAPKIPSSFVEEIKNMDYVGFTGGLASHLPGIS
jgi:nickel-dependent lactate racemase